jgi:N-methylhydantoinase A
MDERGTIALGVDVGGTFTDVVLLVDGEVTTAKVPTTETDQSEGVLAGIDAACEAAGVDAGQVDQFRHAMTVSTNAMLEATGATTALVTTDGFGDVLAIGRQNRPALYDLSAQRPDPLVPAERRYELDERATPSGIERSVDEKEIATVADDIAASDAESVAISLLHAYAHPGNERAVAEHLRDRLDATVVASHETLAAFREYERTATTVADAYVTPVIDGYVGRLQRRASERGLPVVQVMQSNGGIADAETVREHGVTTALSGPAAGVVGASLFEFDAHDGIITFDMGGTSSDVSLVRDGDIEETTEADIAGHPVRVPMVDVETVGAGGGSIAHVDAGGALRVGPGSAGADPGPACYGKGGDDPTVTDANLVLGYLGDDTELGEGLALDGDRAHDAMATLAAAADLDGAVAAARGVYRVANARMARAIRSVTVERGHDPRAFGLVAFGGAGPMHAAALAERLDVETIRVPRANGVLSALGLLAADEQHDTLRTVQTPLATADPDALDDQFAELAGAVRADASDPDAARITRTADLRYAGQSHELTVDVPDPFDAGTVADRFEQSHDRARGYHLRDEPIQIVTLRATATIPGREPVISHEGSGDAWSGRRVAYFGGESHETPVSDRERLTAGTDVDGPAIIEGGESTVVVPPAWEATVDDWGTLVMER